MNQKLSTKRPPKNFFFKSYSYFMCMSVLPTFMSVYHTRAWKQQRPEEGIRSHVTKPGSSAGRASTLNHRAIFSAP